MPLTLETRLVEVAVARSAMASLPTISGRQAREAFIKDGWTFVRQRGNYMILIKSRTWDSSSTAGLGMEPYQPLPVSWTIPSAMASLR